MCSIVEHHIECIIIIIYMMGAKMELCVRWAVVSTSSVKSIKDEPVKSSILDALIGLRVIKVADDQ